VDGIEEIIDSLAGRFRIALLSNTSAAHWACCQATSATLLAKLGPRFLSFELAMAKPDPLIFEHVTSTLGLQPRECLFIDDTEANVTAASRAGLHAVRFVNSGQLRDELVRNGLPMA
jgi:HAD superfamily hydrolase (TIGR01509 family)